MARHNPFGMDILIQSRPIPVEILGLQSDTLSLQRAGWDFLAHESIESWSVRLMARHRGTGIVAKLEAMDDFGRLLGHYGRGFSGMPAERMFQPEAMPQGFRAVWVASEKYVTIMEDLNGFHPVDMRPQVIELRAGGKPLTEFNLFRSLVPEVREIIVDPTDVQHCLDLILKLQAPQLAEVRKRNRQREAGEASAASLVQAQIITLAA